MVSTSHCDLDLKAYSASVIVLNVYTCRWLWRVVS